MRYPRREREQPKFYSPSSSNMTQGIDRGEDSPTLSTIREAIDSVASQQWISAVQSELASLQQHSTCQPVHKPSGCKPITTKFVFNKKQRENGSIDRYKARLVARGFLHSPVVDFTAVRTALTVSVQKGMFIRQLDIKTAFLHGEIDSVVSVSPPTGLKEMGLKLCNADQVLRLNKGCMVFVRPHDYGI